MKITPEHLAKMEQLLVPVIASKPVTEYANEHPTYSPTRVRFDYWNATGKDGLEFTVKTLYPYANDSHIETALKSILGF